MNNNISLLVNTLNERENIDKNIVPIAHIFNEVIIVDMMSDDGSREMLSHVPNCTFIEIEKLGYVEPARKKGIDTCKNSWVFILDADESPSKKLLDDIKKFQQGTSSGLDALREGNGLFIPRLNSMFGHDISWGKFSPYNDRQLRLFHKDSVVISDVIHNGLKFKENTAITILDFSLGYYIYHYHSTSALQFISRIVRYAEFENTNKSGNDSFNISGCIKAFLREYVKERGFKHGRVGFALAFILALREFLKGT